MCAKKINTANDKPQKNEPDGKAPKRKTQKEEINDEIEQLLHILKNQRKDKKTNSHTSQLKKTATAEV
jgi:hypothetical protein